jgi:hypothetical protein
MLNIRFYCETLAGKFPSNLTEIGRSINSSNNKNNNNTPENRFPSSQGRFVTRDKEVTRYLTTEPLSPSSSFLVGTPSQVLCHNLDNLYSVQERPGSLPHLHQDYDPPPLHYQLQAGLAIKNPPKKTPKKPTKNVFFGIFLIFNFL